MTAADLYAVNLLAASLESELQDTHKRLTEQELALTRERESHESTLPQRAGIGCRLQCCMYSASTNVMYVMSECWG